MANIFVEIAKLKQNRREEARVKLEDKLARLKESRKDMEKTAKIDNAIQNEKAAIRSLKKKSHLFEGLKSGVKKAMQNAKEGKALVSGRDITMSERNIHEGVGRNIWNDQPERNVWEEKKRKTIWD